MLNVRSRAELMITRLNKVVHPLVRALIDELGARPIDVAKAAHRDPAVISGWRAGDDQPTPEDETALAEAMEIALPIAEQVLGQTAVEHPALVQTAGYRRYAERVHEAKKLYESYKGAKGKEAGDGHANR